MARPLSDKAQQVIQFLGEDARTYADIRACLELDDAAAWSLINRLVYRKRLLVIDRQKQPHCKKPVRYYQAVRAA